MKPLQSAVLGRKALQNNICDVFVLHINRNLLWIEWGDETTCLSPMTTPHKITNLLNRKELTVNELARELGISRNSVHLQVSKLEAAGIVEKFHRDQPSGAGKPAYVFRLVTGNEDSFSSAYKPVLSGLIETISADLPRKERTQLLEKTGRSLARNAGLTPGPNLDANVRKSVNAVNTLGAMAELTHKDKKPYVSCHSCPVATLVHTDPLVCRLVAAFFSEATGKHVAVQCRHEGSVVCGFSFDEH